MSFPSAEINTPPMRPSSIMFTRVTGLPISSAVCSSRRFTISFSSGTTEYTVPRIPCLSSPRSSSPSASTWLKWYRPWRSNRMQKNASVSSLIWLPNMSRIHSSLVSFPISPSVSIWKKFSSSIRSLFSTASSSVTVSICPHSFFTSVCSVILSMMNPQLLL